MERRQLFATMQQIARERGLSMEDLKGELERALAAAYKRHVGASGDVTVKIDLETGDLQAVCEKEVVGHVTNNFFQIGIDEAKKRNPDAEIGDFIPVAIAPETFGRIAASTFKQVLRQLLRDAERRRTFEEFKDRVGDVVTAEVSHRLKNGDVVLKVGHGECILPRREQVPTEPYRPGQRLKVYVLEIQEDERRGPRVLVSRTHPNLVRRLFEVEVPEIERGVVEIMGIAREPGHRTKIAVRSHDERVDPVGAFVGQRGARVQSIVNELYDEKIDIVPYSENPSEYIANALSPAKVLKITVGEVKDSEGNVRNVARVVVPDSQSSLAIGKGGQNVRLAGFLTRHDITVTPESKAHEEDEPAQKA
ncbi:MAG: transcription termination/antitermination protein NusA [Armatimonadetes bacterium]|nr:MAG: transcription termination/antitermination protein NusA [Armatimonadota bacterium]